MAGYTVVDLPTVMATHLTEILRTHAHELLGRQEAQPADREFQENAIRKWWKSLIPEPMLPLGSGRSGICKTLLKGQVSIRDLR
jgi:flagellar biosynthesis protein FlhA